MQFSYPKVQALCHENGITPTSLEKKLSFGNGTIKKWATVSPRLDKVIQVATYFNVTVNDLLDGIETKETPTLEGERQANFTLELVRFLLTIPKDRLRGILLALAAPEELLSVLDQKEPL